MKNKFIFLPFLYLISLYSAQQTFSYKDFVQTSSYIFPEDLSKNNKEKYIKTLKLLDEKLFSFINSGATWCTVHILKSMLKKFNNKIKKSIINNERFNYNYAVDILTSLINELKMPKRIPRENIKTIQNRLEIIVKNIDNTFNEKIIHDIIIQEIPKQDDIEFISCIIESESAKQLLQDSIFWQNHNNVFNIFFILFVQNNNNNNNNNFCNTLCNFINYYYHAHKNIDSKMKLHYLCMLEALIEKVQLDKNKNNYLKVLKELATNMRQNIAQETDQNNFLPLQDYETYYNALNKIIKDHISEDAYIIQYHIFQASKQANLTNLKTYFDNHQIIQKIKNNSKKNASMNHACTLGKIFLELLDKTNKTNKDINNRLVYDKEYKENYELHI